MPLPVFTLSAAILTSRTPVEASLEVNVSVPSHWSNVPSIETDALTAKCMELPSGVILRIGISPEAWARLMVENPRERRTICRESNVLGDFMLFVTSVCSSQLVRLDISERNTQQDVAVSSQYPNGGLRIGEDGEDGGVAGAQKGTQ